MKSDLRLLPLTEEVTASEVEKISPSGHLYACDFRIEGVEGDKSYIEKPWGFEKPYGDQNGVLVNIDHHADVPRMRARVSSANLALLAVSGQGIAQAGDTVVINHTDCDSVLSSAIMRGDLEPLQLFGDAAIAADHTGEANAIADLLQALNDHRDYDFSLRNLRLLLNSAPLDAEAQRALDARLASRDKAAELVRSGAFTLQDSVAWTVLEKSTDGELFPPLLPDAVLIALFSPRSKEDGKWDVKIRLGNAAPDNFSLTSTMKEIDSHYRGRWNAGSNKRSGGSFDHPEKYAAKMGERICAVLAQ